MPAPSGSDGGDHLHGHHAPLARSIHLRHHHAHAHDGSGRRRSPTGSTALMRDLLALQRSRSLRDPTTRRSVDSASNSRVAAVPEGDQQPARGSALKTLLDQLAENPQQQHKPARRPRRRAPRRAALAGAVDRAAVSSQFQLTGFTGGRLRQQVPFWRRRRRRRRH
jgi:hypothetical protein